MQHGWIELQESKTIVSRALKESASTSQDLARLTFEEVCCRFGIPERLTHDNDVRFKTMWQELWRLIGIKLVFTSSYNPHSDPAERDNKQTGRNCDQSKVEATPGGKRKKVGSSSQDNKEENQDKEISGGDSATEALDVLDERNESVVDTCFAGTEDPGNLSACTCSRKFSRCFENFQDVLKT